MIKLNPKIRYKNKKLIPKRKCSASNMFTPLWLCSTHIMIWNYILRCNIETIFIHFPQNSRYVWLKVSHQTLKFSKEPNQTREPSVTCSYICHVNISEYMYCLNTQSVKIPKKRNKIKGRSITCSHI